MNKKYAMRLHIGDEVLLKKTESAMIVVSDARIENNLVIVDLVDDAGCLYESVIHTEIL